MRKQPTTPPVTMEDIFQAMQHIEEEHHVRVGLVIFPVQLPELQANFGLSVRVYDPTGKCIREVSCSHTYWPSAKYTTWEAAALDCINATYKELTETYLPLMAYLNRW